MDPLRYEVEDIEAPLPSHGTRKLRFRGWYVVLLAILAWVLVVTAIVVLVRFS